MARRQAASETNPDATTAALVSTTNGDGRLTYDPGPLLAALKGTQKGRLSSPAGDRGEGLAQAVAEAFNDVAELLEHSPEETERIANLVGRRGGSRNGHAQAQRPGGGPTWLTGSTR